MKTNKVTTALILVLVFLLAVLGGEVIMYERLLRPGTHMWEIRAVKVKDVGEFVLPPKWEIMSYDKETNILYMKRRVDKDADWQAKPRYPETIPRHRKSPKITEA
jgi:hypothetical protein